MYANVAVLAAFAFLYAAVSGGVARSRLSGPIVFVLGGLLLGPAAAGVLDLDVSAEGLRLLAELTLAIVLFTDAANADVARIVRNPGLPERLLGIGLPLTILLGLGVGLLLFPGLDLIEVALIAAILAPTDAALGKPVVTNAAVPPDIREALNFESGLNDGICVPLVLLLLGVAVGTEIEGRPAAHVAATIVEEIGIGLLAGAILSLGAAALLRRAAARAWIAPNWGSISVIALALACFAAAQALGGSGFIACFAGGLAFRIPPAARHPLLRAAEGTGEVLALLAWTAFGAVVVAQVADRITPVVVLYSILSLTVIRMLPVYLALMRANVALRDRFFIGWFGPRGLASVVFGVLILDSDLPGIGTVEATIACTVLFSVLAHGVTANPLVRALAARHNGPI